MTASKKQQPETVLQSQGVYSANDLNKLEADFPQELLVRNAAELKPSF